jgi:glycosyltransferase involved in cell wall biosynthesis
MKHTISVLIPVYNGEQYLSSCLQSILEQDISVDQIIIVDNNSTDKTKEIILDFQKKDARIMYVFEKMRTRGAARNAGIRAATGEVVVMTDVDCVVPKDWVRKLTEPIQEGKEKVVTGYQYNLIPQNYWAREMQRKCDYFLDYKRPEPGYISFTDTKNLAIETKLLRETMFDERFLALEDVDFELRLRPIVRFRFLPDVQVGHAHSRSARAVWKLAYERSYWFAQLYHKFKGKPDQNGHIIFEEVSAWFFYTRLFQLNLGALKVQGWRHILFFIVFDGAWKVGSAVGFWRKHPSL